MADSALTVDFPVNVAPASPPSRALHFRTQLLLALMLVVCAITGVGLVLAERNLAAGVTRDLENTFDAELTALRRVQELRHAALVERCRALVRKPGSTPRSKTVR